MNVETTTQMERSRRVSESSLSAHSLSPGKKFCVLFANGDEEADELAASHALTHVDCCCCCSWLLECCAANPLFLIHFLLPVTFRLLMLVTNMYRSHHHNRLLLLLLSFAKSANETTTQPLFALPELDRLLCIAGDA